MVVDREKGQDFNVDGDVLQRDWVRDTRLKIFTQLSYSRVLFLVSWLSFLQGRSQGTKKFCENLSGALEVMMMVESDDEVVDISNALLEADDTTADPFDFNDAPPAKRTKTGGKHGRNDTADNGTDVFDNETAYKAKLNGSSFKNMGSLLSVSSLIGRIRKHFTKSDC